MLKICDLKDNKKYLREFVTLTQKEWGDKNLSAKEVEQKLTRKIEKTIELMDKVDYCTLILLLNKQLVGFISLFPTDGDERKDLTPWYATMYVKEEYRGRGYSKVLNNAILQEAEKRGFSRIYLKSDLNNYYEKFGAKYMETLSNGEKLYYIDL